MLDIMIIIPMRLSLSIATFLVPFLISTPVFAALIDSPSTIGTTSCHHDHDQHQHASASAFWIERENMMERRVEDGKSEKVGSKRSRRTLQIAGSRVPDCLHACGSCSPCRLVIISLACASHTDEVESCPISYRCMCNSKSYPVP